MHKSLLLSQTAFLLICLLCCLWFSTRTVYAIDSIPVMLRLLEEVNVPAREEGQILEMLVQEGGIVQENSLLAQIDDQEAELKLQLKTLEWKNAQQKATSQIKLQLASKALEVSSRELNRAEVADKRFDRSVSKTELDRLRLSQDKAKLEIEQAKLELEEFKYLERHAYTEMRVIDHEKKRHQIIAPIRALVAEVYVHKGEWVRPGDQVVRLVRIDRLRAEGFIDSSALSGHLMGAQATLSIDLPGGLQQTLPAKVVFVSPEINPVNGQVRVWAEVENQDGKLHPGLPASLQVTPDRP